MRSSIVMLAGLASTALAYPTDVAPERRTFGPALALLGEAVPEVVNIIESVLGGHSSAHASSQSSAHASVSVLAGLNAHAAAALEGGAFGCKSSVIHGTARKQLKAWLSVNVDFDPSLKTSIISWCDGEVDVLSTDVIAALGVFIPTCAEVAAKEAIYVTIDGIFDATELASDLVLSVSAQVSLSAWIEAAVDLAVEVKAGLSVCAGGGLISSVSADVKVALLAWITGGNCPLEAGLKASVLAWIRGHAGGDLVAIGEIGADALKSISIGASVGAFVGEAGALTVHAQAMLAAFLDSKIAVDIEADVLLGLTSCAKGELAASVDIEIRKSLSVWLSGSNCSLGVELKAVVLLWLSLGASVDVSVDLVSGLGIDIRDFLSVSITDILSVNLRAALSILAAGESLELLCFDARAELAAFLSGCTSIDISINIELIIFEWFTGCSMPGAPAPSSSVPSLPSSTGAMSSIPMTSGPAPTGSASVSIPAGSTPGGSIPTGSVPAGSTPGGSVPTGSVPAGSTPGGSVPTGSVPAGSVPGGSIPTGSVPAAATTPCDTETSVWVTSTVISGTPSPITITGSVPVPTGSVPAAATTPCDTETSVWVTSTVISGTPSPITITGSVPVPTGTSPAETTPCETETSTWVTSTVISGYTSVVTVTGVVPAPTGSAPSGTVPAGGSVPSGSSPVESETPCDTATPTVVPGGSGSTGSETSSVAVPPAMTSAPAGPAGGSGSDVETVTVTATATVCGCE
ncbi:uncharacterized protein N7498_006974 [Penicillium cinerascens]|uniref:Cell wall protein n=1 Tax=Penicillium cinerascens TaxID=70096 RepID=A0A9W9MF10_9EURO|nr:uncharacterized protein N7498_006974 [Penicillium cinerascens]KAJ5197857.1 hypothetical protein N7498_006974 [Penicillium cinerascens]